MISTKVKLYTLAEVAGICRVPLPPVRYWQSMRKIKVVKVGRQALTLGEDLYSFLRSSAEPTSKMAEISVGAGRR